MILDTAAEYIKFAINITNTTSNNHFVKSSVPICAAIALLKGLITNSEKRTIKKKNPENMAFVFCFKVATTTEIYTRFLLKANFLEIN